MKTRANGPLLDEPQHQGDIVQIAFQKLLYYIISSSKYYTSSYFILPKIRLLTKLSIGIKLVSGEAC